MNTEAAIEFVTSYLEQLYEADRVYKAERRSIAGHRSVQPDEGKALLESALEAKRAAFRHHWSFEPEEHEHFPGFVGWPSEHDPTQTRNWAAREVAPGQFEVEFKKQGPLLPSKCVYEVHVVTGVARIMSCNETSEA